MKKLAAIAAAAVMILASGCEELINAQQQSQAPNEVHTHSHASSVTSFDTFLPATGSIAEGQYWGYTNGVSEVREMNTVEAHRAEHIRSYYESLPQAWIAETISQIDIYYFDGEPEGRSINGVQLPYKNSNGKQVLILFRGAKSSYSTYIHELAHAASSLGTIDKQAVLQHAPLELYSLYTVWYNVSTGSSRSVDFMAEELFADLVSRSFGFLPSYATTALRASTDPAYNGPTDFEDTKRLFDKWLTTFEVTQQLS